MIRTIAILALFVACAQAKNVSFTNCSPTGKINWVNVDPCDVEPCTFKPGEEVTVKGELVSESASDGPQLVVEVKVVGIWVKYPGLDSDACKYLTCPLKAQTVTPFKITLTTLAWLPPMSTQIRFQLLGSDGSQYNCAQADIKIA